MTVVLPTAPINIKMERSETKLSITPFLFYGDESRCVFIKWSCQCQTILGINSKHNQSSWYYNSIVIHQLFLCAFLLKRTKIFKKCQILSLFILTICLATLHAMHLSWWVPLVKNAAFISKNCQKKSKKVITMSPDFEMSSFFVTNDNFCIQKQWQVQKN